MKYGSFDTHDVKTCCEKKLAISFRSGKELSGWVMINGRKVARVTVPMGRKDILPKTYKSMATQLKLTTDQFDNLLECPLDWRGYNEVLARRPELIDVFRGTDRQVRKIKISKKKRRN